MKQLRRWIAVLVAKHPSRWISIGVVAVVAASAAIAAYFGVFEDTDLRHVTRAVAIRAPAKATPSGPRRKSVECRRRDPAPRAFICRVMYDDRTTMWTAEIDEFGVVQVKP